MKPKDITEAEEAAYYKEKILDMRSLSSRILTVAVKGDAGTDWAAYIGVIDHSFEKEAKNVASKGNKLPYEIAVYLYPKIAAKFSWRP